MSRKTQAGLLVVVVLAAGCRGAPPPPCRVSGTVTVNSRPAAKAYVRFHPLAEPARLLAPDVARVEPDGSFTLSVKSPGEYAVSLYWPALTYTLPGEQGEEVEGEDWLKGRYNSPQQPALNVTIQAGDNPLPPIALTIP